MFSHTVSDRTRRSSQFNVWTCHKQGHSVHSVTATADGAGRLETCCIIPVIYVWAHFTPSLFITHNICISNKIKDVPCRYYQSSALWTCPNSFFVSISLFFTFLLLYQTFPLQITYMFVIIAERITCCASLAGGFCVFVCACACLCKSRSCCCSLQQF